MVSSKNKEITAFATPVITAAIAIFAQFGISMTDEQKFVVVLIGFILGVVIMISALFIDEWQKKSKILSELIGDSITEWKNQRQFKNDQDIANELARNPKRLKRILISIYGDRGITGGLTTAANNDLNQLIQKIQ